MGPVFFLSQKKWLFGISITLLILGLGNLLFAHYKLKEYSAIAESAIPKNPPQQETSWLPSELNRSSTLDYQTEKVRIRLEYYELTKRGGLAFIIVGLVILFFAIVKRPIPIH